MGSEDNHVIHAVGHIYKDVELFGHGPKAKELSDIIKQHALAATGIAFIPVPVLDVAAVVANIWTMYARLNSAIGVSFSENVVKSIASGVAANLVSAIPAAVLGIVAESVLKFIPGLGTMGGIAVGAAANVAMLYVAGKVYLKSLEILVHSHQPLTEENIKKAAADVTRDKAFIKSAYAEGKDTAKNR
jgi:uncharacterized protein (DUF697 family)